MATEGNCTQQPMDDWTCGSVYDTDETQTQPDAEPPCHWRSGEPHTLSTASDLATASRRRRRRNGRSTVARMVDGREYVPADCDRTIDVNCSWSSKRSEQLLPLRRSPESVYCDELQARGCDGSEYMYKMPHRDGTGTMRCTEAATAAGCEWSAPRANAGNESDSSSTLYSRSITATDSSSGSTVCGGEGTGAGRSLTACAADAAAAIVLSMSARQSDVASLRRQSERNGSAVRQLSDAMRIFFCAIADGQHSD